VERAALGLATPLGLQYEFLHEKTLICRSSICRTGGLSQTIIHLLLYLRNSNYVQYKARGRWGEM